MSAAATPGVVRRATAEATIARLAGSQHGLVARCQLLAQGIPTHVVDRCLRSGWLRRVHRGVYQVGPVEAPHARLMAACLACGPTSVVSHRSAGLLWGMLSAGRAEDPPEVTIRGAARRRHGVRVHRSRTLHGDEVTTVEGLPATTPERTLLDLSRGAGSRELERALAEAVALRLTTTADVLRITRRHPGCRGARHLRAIIHPGPPALTRSEAEERFLALIRKARIDPPTANCQVEGHEVDFLWRAAGLVVEIDGFAYHASRTSFEADRRRDALLAASGLRVVRVTWRHLVDEPEAVLVRLAQALVSGGPRRGR